jgi:hypothetical protein
MLNESDLIEKLNKVKIFDSDLIIRGESITNLGKIEIIKGTLGINNSGIENLGNIIEIQKDFWISSHTVFSNLNSLDNLEVVGGDLNLRYSNISDLGSLKKVGGKLNLRDTPIRDLGLLNYVGGDLFLPKRLQDSVDLTGITIKGVLKYWNDDKKYIKPISKVELGLIKSSRLIPKWSESNTFSLDVLDFDNREQKEFYLEFRNQFLNDVYIDIEGNDFYAFYLQNDLKENYSDDTDTFLNLYSKLTRHYPITKKYSHHAITNKLESNNNYSKAWELISQRPSLVFETVIDYEKKLGVNLVDGAIIEKLSGHSHLTDFGQRNIEKIIPFADEVLKSSLRTKNKSFFSQFFKNGLPISQKATYYKKFFLSTSEYKHYKWIDESQAKSNYKRNVPHVVEKAIYSQCKNILKQAEDLYREAIGMPKVGEGWISETELYYKISDSFKELEVIHHASPKWLGRQHLDIFIPKYKIGIEYQGTQHYEPIDFFGGQEAFEKNIERDERKKRICQKNGCELIYVDEGYQISEIVSKIENIIKGL